MSVKVLTEHHFEFLSFKGKCRGFSESTRVKMPNCWKSHVTAHYVIEHSDACPLVNLKTKTAKGRESKTRNVIQLSRNYIFDQSRNTFQLKYCPEYPPTF